MVTQQSATSVGLGFAADEDKLGLKTDHSGLVKYDNRQEPYNIMLRKLETLVDGAGRAVSRRSAGETGMSRSARYASNQISLLTAMYRSDAGTAAFVA